MYWLWEKTCTRVPWVWLMVVLTLVGCVGTIEDTKVPKSQTVPTSVPSISFKGIHDAQPIANDKIEVSFFPAVGDAEDLIYLINYDGLSSPITVPALYLKPNYLGILVYTVLGLESNASYNFEVQVKNSETKGYSQSEAQKLATTFGNITANFLGIQNVENMPGLAGITSIKVIWAEAEKQGSSFSPKELDPKKYVITVINGDVLSPGDMHNTAFGDPLRKVVYVNPGEISTVVGGLEGDTLYYVSVRCIHHGYTLYGNDLNYHKEINSKYLEIKTLKGGVNNLDFNTDGVTVALMPGVQGLTSVSAQWEAASGAFESYRVYYAPKSSSQMISYLATGSPDSVCDGQEQSNPDYYCKQVDYLTTSAILIDMIPNSDYSIVVAVCQSVTCTASTRVLSSVEAIETTPQVATYSGVQSISPARELNKLDYLYLEVVPPDLTTGVMDGVIIEYVNYLGSVIVPLNHPCAVVGPNCPDAKPNISPLNLLNFNFQTDNELTITNVYPFSVTPYCFRAFPYTWENGVVVEHSANAVAYCLVPKVEPPTLAQFPGATDCQPGTVPGSVLVSWDVPAGGIYSNFEIFVQGPPAGGFDFGVATNTPTPFPYTRYLVPDTLNEYTVEGLVSGQGYMVGVVTYVNVNGILMRSISTNASAKSCTAQ